LGKKKKKKWKGKTPLEEESAKLRRRKNKI
jgi:hypothetical protein